jgi:glycosyltransferase involved in cell wall biosynthesis
MKIVLCPLHYLPVVGGSEVQVHRLAQGFQKLGHQVIAIANHFGKGLVEESYEEISIYRFPFLSSLAAKDLSAIKEILARAAKILSSFSPDVINTHALVAPLNFYHNRFIHAPLCATTHGGLVEAEDGKKSESARLLSKADQISSPAQHFLDFLSIDQPNVRIIPNGLPLPATPLQPIPTSPRIALIGRCAPEKGFGAALLAIKTILPKYPNLKAFLVGDGPLLQDFRKQIATLQIAHAVEIVGAVPPAQVHHWIDRAQVVLIPSTHECLNLVALETGQRGRPVLASDIFGLKESVENGITGYLVPPGDVEAFADRLDHLLSNPELIRWMGQRGFAKITREYCFEKTIQNYLEMYECAIQTHR